MKLILITGGSASGKTSITNKIKEHKNNSTIINLDDYYYEESKLINIQKKINWDLPSAFNWDQLLIDLKALLSGKKVKKSSFVYGKNIRGDIKEYVPNDLLILEGIFSPYIKEIRKLSSKIIYLDSDDGVRYKRRLQRDEKLIPNFEKKNFLKDWNEKVIPTQKKYIDKFKKEANIIVDTNNIERDSLFIMEIIVKSL